MQAHFTRPSLLADGWTDSDIRSAHRQGDLVRERRGGYLGPPDGTNDQWKARLLLGVCRAGTDAVASHRAAAKLHGLDGDWGEPLQVLGPKNSAARGPGFFRSTPLPPGHRIVVEGVPCTSLARTLVDLGRVTDLDTVEMAVESALRGDEPRRPHEWNDELFVEITTWPLTPRVLGHLRLRHVLNRRPENALPTGSPAETRALQLLRSVGFAKTLERQSLVHVHDLRTGQKHSAYPDFLYPGAALAIEIDGAAFHTSDDARSRDHRRENVLGSALRILRYTASDLRRRPVEIRAELARELTVASRTGCPARIRWTPQGPNVHRYEVLT